VIASVDDALRSGPWAPYPLDQVKYLDDDVSELLLEMDDNEAAWVKVLQEVLKVRSHLLQGSLLLLEEMLARATIPVTHGAVITGHCLAA
jgi:hypothetical protein